MNLLNLCICDDRENDINKIRQLTYRFMEEHPELPIRIQEFYSAYDLLEYIKKYGGFELYLLDIQMPDLTGMDVARRIRERGEAAEILFLTVSQEYAMEAFGVKASGYLLKPLKWEDFNQAVLFCIRNLAPKENPALILKTKDGLFRVPVRELVIIESFNHRRVCTLNNGITIETADTLSSLKEQLSAYPGFYMPHRAYIVNFDYVNGLNASNLLMTNGKQIPVSRKIHAGLKDAFIKYVMKEIPGGGYILNEIEYLSRRKSDISRMRCAFFLFLN